VVGEYVLAAHRHRGNKFLTIGFIIAEAFKRQVNLINDFLFL